MNYASDALWWRLSSPAVRDLASLLTAPPLWHSSCEIPVRELLGACGFRYLLSLDDQPAPLKNYLSGRAPFGNRLGLYAEHLLAFWFANAPHTQLHAHNLPVFSDGLTEGSADFIATLNGTAYHIELTCKYYGSSNGSMQNLAGLNPDDRFYDKAARLTRQLALLQSSDGLKALSAAGLPNRLKPASIVRGIGFFPEGHASPGQLNPLGWHGVYARDWADYAFPDSSTRYHPLPRMNLLAPARIPEAETLSAEQIRQTGRGIVASVTLRPDGFWHEAGRIMKA